MFSDRRVEPLVATDHLNYYFGEGTLRRQILFDISLEVLPGEIVILTGPSGSGKTTLLTLIGGLRSAQEGSLRVLGHQLDGASEATRAGVRRNVGYIFQAHNLLAALSACQNVEMALQLHREVRAGERRTQSVTTLQAVGLGEYIDKYPDQLSGGQKQRVAIARALVNRPKMILADEPTASLDKKSGRDVVELMQGLAKQQGCTVVLVTHDNRILDIADRIIHLEDGHLVSFTTGVAASASQLLGMLAQNARKGELARRVASLPAGEFVGLLRDMTGELEQLLSAIQLSSQDAFQGMLEQLLEACTIKVGAALDAERATLFLLDRQRGELWSKVAQSDGENPVEIRIPQHHGIAGHVAQSGLPLSVADAYADPRFDATTDNNTGYRTRSILAAPIKDHGGQVVAVVQLLNKRSGVPFVAADTTQLEQVTGPLGVLLESWTLMRGRVATLTATDAPPVASA